MPVSSSRRTYIDWLRGLAVLCMVEWHAVDAWTLTSDRDGTAFTVLGYLGGWAAPLFLFLAGLAIPLAAEANIRKGLSVREAAWALQKRGWQILLLAHIFKLQSYLLNPYAVWHGIFKPDILNILGLGMVATAFCWGRADTLRSRLVWLLTPAVLAVALTTIVRWWWWPTLLHPRLEAYLRPNGGFGVFALFPWTAYVFLGAALGLWIAMQRTPEGDRRFHGYLAGVGMLIVAVGSALGSPWSGVVSRTGGMIVALAVAWLWMQHRAPLDGVQSSCSDRPRCSSIGCTSSWRTASSRAPSRRASRCRRPCSPTPSSSDCSCGPRTHGRTGRSPGFRLTSRYPPRLCSSPCRCRRC